MISGQRHPAKASQSIRSSVPCCQCGLSVFLPPLERSPREGHKVSMKNTVSGSDEPLIAVFIDFENLAIGVRGMKTGHFQIQLVLKRLLEKARL